MKICDMEYCSEEIDNDENLCVRCDKEMFNAQVELEEHGLPELSAEELDSIGVQQ